MALNIFDLIGQGRRGQSARDSVAFSERQARRAVNTATQTGTSGSAAGAQVAAMAQTEQRAAGAGMIAAADQADRSAQGEAIASAVGAGAGLLANIIPGGGAVAEPFINMGKGIFTKAFAGDGPGPSAPSSTQGMFQGFEMVPPPQPMQPFQMQVGGPAQAAAQGLTQAPPGGAQQPLQQATQLPQGAPQHAQIGQPGEFVDPNAAVQQGNMLPTQQLGMQLGVQQPYQLQPNQPAQQLAAPPGPPMAGTPVQQPTAAGQALQPSPFPTPQPASVQQTATPSATAPSAGAQSPSLGLPAIFDPALSTDDILRMLLGMRGR